MSIGIILEVLLALFKFPSELSAFVKLLSKTPEEKHDALMKTISDEAQKFSDTGRPS